MLYTSYLLNFIFTLILHLSWLQKRLIFFLFFSVHERIIISRKPWVISQWCWVILSISRNTTTTNNKSNVQYTLWKTEVGKLWTAQMFVQLLFMRVALSHFQVLSSISATSSSHASCSDQTMLSSPAATEIGKAPLLACSRANNHTPPHN